jgi:hypothetical protein
MSPEFFSHVKRLFSNKREISERETHRPTASLKEFYDHFNPLDTNSLKVETTGEEVQGRNEWITRISTEKTNGPTILFHEQPPFPQDRRELTNLTPDDFVSGFLLAQCFEGEARHDLLSLLSRHDALGRHVLPLSTPQVLDLLLHSRVYSNTQFPEMFEGVSFTELATRIHSAGDLARVLLRVEGFTPVHLFDWISKIKTKHPQIAERMRQVFIDQFTKNPEGVSLLSSVKAAASEMDPGEFIGWGLTFIDELDESYEAISTCWLSHGLKYRVRYDVLLSCLAPPRSLIPDNHELRQEMNLAVGKWIHTLMEAAVQSYEEDELAPSDPRPQRLVFLTEFAKALNDIKETEPNLYQKAFLAGNRITPLVTHRLVGDSAERTPEVIADFIRKLPVKKNNLSPAHLLE